MINGEITNTESSTKVSADWKDNLPKDVRDWDEVKNSDSPEKFYQQIASHRKMIGQSIRVPTEDAGPETMQEFYEKLQKKVPALMRTPDVDDDESVTSVLRSLGAPVEPDGYGSFDDADINEFRTVALKAGLTKKQFSKLAEDLSANNRAGQEARQNKIDAEQAALKKEWGHAFDQNLGVVSAMAKATGAPPEFLEALDKGLLDAASVKWLHGMAKQLGGEAMAVASQSGALSPSEASDQIDDMMNNKDHPYWNASHPNHEKAKEKMITLMRAKMAK